VRLPIGFVETGKKESEKMATKLISNFVFACIEDDVIMVGFADDEFNTKEHLLLQKALEFDEQDIALGHDKVHITYFDELYSSYGGIVKLELKNNIVEIQIDKDTAKKLNTEEQLEISLPEAYDRTNLIYHLKLMFKDNTDTLFIK
jgi:hypothetical protein